VKKVSMLILSEDKNEKETLEEVRMTWPSEDDHYFDTYQPVPKDKRKSNPHFRIYALI
jgi:hypothetical protein